MASQSLETASSLRDFFCSFTHKNKKYMQCIVNRKYIKDFFFNRKAKKPQLGGLSNYSCLLISNWNGTVRQ